MEMPLRYCGPRALLMGLSNTAFSGRTCLMTIASLEKPSYKESSSVRCNASFGGMSDVRHRGSHMSARASRLPRPGLELSEHYCLAHFAEPPHYAIALPRFLGGRRRRIRIVTVVPLPYAKAIATPPNVQLDMPVWKLITHSQRLALPYSFNSLFSVAFGQASPLDYE